MTATPDCCLLNSTVAALVMKKIRSSTWDYFSSVIFVLLISQDRLIRLKLVTRQSDSSQAKIYQLQRLLSPAPVITPSFSCTPTNHHLSLFSEWETLFHGKTWQWKENEGDVIYRFSCLLLTSLTRFPQVMVLLESHGSQSILWVNHGISWNWIKKSINSCATNNCSSCRFCCVHRIKKLILNWNWSAFY